MGEDLIKRSDVLSILEKVFDKYRMSFGDDSGGFAEAVPKAIKSISPAYDVDEVVKQLEDLDVYFDNDYSSSNKEEILIRKEVFEIVKAGGIG